MAFPARSRKGKERCLDGEDGETHSGEADESDSLPEFSRQGPNAHRLLIAIQRIRYKTPRPCVLEAPRWTSSQIAQSLRQWICLGAQVLPLR